jgi:hypothetical protein
MFAVTSNDVIHGTFDTMRAAQTCARITSRKLGITVTIERYDAPDAEPESAKPAQDDLLNEALGIAPPSLGEVWDTLNTFDWFYEMSDDHSVWKRGHAAKARLDSLAAMVDGGAELVSAYTKHIYSGKPWGTEKAPKPARPE